MKGVKELWRGRLISAVNVSPGDTLELRDGDKVVARALITKSAHYENGLLFEAERGIFGEGAGVGGVFLE